ncbi:MAG: ABC transporter ATP-binding protein [Ferruginibacter sp.]|nr:ABC transporter ATP-binding protein [Ferruginibacter sp.]
MTPFQNNLAEVKFNFDNNNDNLGFRMLVDVVLDTNKITNFNEIIFIANWYEQNGNEQLAFKEKCLALICKLEKQTLKTSDTTKLLVSAKNIKKRYGKNNFELGTVNFEIHVGQLIGLVGENGNGKTTLLRMLAKELAISEGEIIYSFADKSIDDYTLRTKLTYIPQRTPKWFGNVKDNLKLTCTHYGIAPLENEQWVSMLMIRFGLWKYRNHNWEELSSGYKMRFELARTFLRKPKLLLLDEPLANLDILSQQLILEDLKMLGKSLSNPLGIILSSQQLYEVEKVSDEVVFLQNGKASSFNNLKNETQENNLVVEVEIENSKAALLQALAAFTVNDIKLLGSNYYVDLKDCNQKQFLQSLLQHDIAMKYYRDISQSTRRFFNN